jgi:hypothetical protein
LDAAGQPWNPAMGARLTFRRRFENAQRGSEKLRQAAEKANARLAAREARRLKRDRVERGGKS